ncbi:MAG TPA: hypothetical protein VE442_05060 [Jatrophihabitans sp.]|jgi:hypothetical protein|nr:hypothetical protein [Jatrophihabitans sp.]
MPNTIEITMTPGGFEVLTGGRTTTFASLDAAVGYARERFARAEHIRDLKTRID